MPSNSKSDGAKAPPAPPSVPPLKELLLISEHNTHISTEIQKVCTILSAPYSLTDSTVMCTIVIIKDFILGRISGEKHALGVSNCKSAIHL